MDNSLKKVYSSITAFSFAVTLILTVSYIFTNRLDNLLYLVWSLLISVLLFCFIDIKKYIIHLFFYITIFIFLVSRPTIDYLRVPIFNTYQKDAYQFAFVIVIISVMGLFLGGIFCNRILKITYRNNKKDNGYEVDKYLKNLRIVSLAVYLISYPFYTLRLLERLFFKLNTDYYTYYATFKSQLPYFTYILSTFMIYSMCVYLASKPNKRSATLVLLSNVFANGIYLLIGTRNPFILSLIFAFLYYFIRNQEGIKKLWIGTKEKIAIIFSVPALMAAMGFLNYIRDGAEVSGFGFFNIIVDFIYKQGTSFGVLARGYLYNSNIPVRNFVNFTFGSIIEYFTMGNLGQILFNTKPFVETTNSVELALKSNSYAHNLSYIVLKKEYLDGHGLGSSFIMENYTDYGYIGVFLFSLFLGALFVYMLRLSYDNRPLGFTCVLMILTNLFFMPRSSFSESFFSLFTFQFWGIIILIFFVAKLIGKTNSYTILRKERI